MPEQEQEQFEIVTTAQVERTYAVAGATEEQARKRLRTWLADTDMVREGLVVEQPDKQEDSTPQKIKAVRKVARPKVVEDAAAKAS